MKLKKIVVCGFKSFADKTEFDFGDGITVIVGPNGCGKSNVVDAVKWVLGEQSAKSLRGNQMLDVIFNGSGTRKPMGFAEVTLVFSNEDRLFSADYDEIAITRKLFRSGESQYKVNGKNARLKDIKDMFMGTGLGSNAYSIIEQGRVTQLLQAPKEERRAIFEEAAGISKYKARKKETLRKLERTEQNMLRLHDIIAELDKQLRAIKIQAGKARNYQSYTTRLNELRLNQYLSDYRKLQQSAEVVKEKIITIQDEIIVLSTEIETRGARLSVLEHESGEVDQEIRQGENQLMQLTSRIGQQQDRIEMGHRRCEEIQTMLQQNNKRIDELRRQSQLLAQQMSEAQEQVDNFQGDLDDRQLRLNELQGERAQQAMELNEYRSQLDDEKSGLMDIVRQTARLHNEINAIDIRCDNLNNQKDRLLGRADVIRQEMQDLLSRKAAFNDKAQQIAVVQESCAAQLEEKRQQLAAVSQQRLECAEELSTAREDRSGLQSRKNLLQDMEAKWEGVDKGVKSILTARKENADNYYYVRGLAAELIRSEVKYAAIVEAALGAAAQNLVVSDSGELLKDQERLGKLAGRVFMTCLDLVSGQTGMPELKADSRILARVSELVTEPDDCRGLAQSLLGQTLLVNDLADAVALSKEMGASWQFVTAKGELLGADGTIAIGAQIAGSGLISRKSELRELDGLLVQATELIASLEQRNQQLDSQTEHLEKNLQDLRTAVYEARTEEVEVRGNLDRIEQNIKRLSQEEPLIASEIAMLETQVASSLETQENGRRQLDDLNRLNSERQSRVEFLDEQISALEARDNEFVEQITNLKVELGQMRQRDLAMRDKIASLRSQVQMADHNMQTLQRDLDNADSNYQETQRSILQAENQISELFGQRQSLQEQVKTQRDRFEELTAERKELATVIRESEHRHNECQQQLHSLQLSYNENRLRCENIVQRAMEEMTLNLEEQLASVEVQEMDWDAVNEEIKDLKQKIGRLGNINLGAIEEQDELEGRVENLNKQYIDLDDARKQMEELIEKINVESTELFRKSFEAIRVNFSELFRKLFGGGRAEVILENPDDILESTIEIIARPPGKQPRSITQLSGGEKTMAAVALIMAIFKSKPSPFCLLDEVDAALDEANVERFNTVVQEFLTESQFVIITHCRRTMSIGDVIYGVTMQEQGVSKKVSVRFDHYDEDAPLEDQGDAVA
ncbi:MAG: chromosome segregation protein SMC [Sedimentisphaerales bacterium]|nr:chromosome segregation protein SMC [Sedimentisphaerales bacterium]